MVHARTTGSHLVALAWAWRLAGECGAGRARAVLGHLRLEAGELTRRPGRLLVRQLKVGGVVQERRARGLYDRGEADGTRIP
jgi:hypothetical protein